MYFEEGKLLKGNDGAKGLTKGILYIRQYERRGNQEACMKSCLNPRAKPDPLNILSDENPLHQPPEAMIQRIQAGGETNKHKQVTPRAQKLCKE